MNKKELNVYLIDEGEDHQFSVIWNDKEEVLEYLKKTFGESQDDTIDMIAELSNEEAEQWGFRWSFDKGETTLNAKETIMYIYKNNIILNKPLLS